MNNLIEGLVIFFLGIVLFRYVLFNYIFDVDCNYPPAERWFRAFRDCAIDIILFGTILVGLFKILDAL